MSVRSRKSGDAYVYAGHTRSVRRRLIDLKIPAYERNALPCILDAQGIIWVPGLRVADRVKSDGKTETDHYIVFARVNGAEE